MERKRSSDDDEEASAAVLQQYKTYKVNVRAKLAEWKKKEREREEREQSEDERDGAILPDIKRRSNFNHDLDSVQ